MPKEVKKLYMKNGQAIDALDIGACNLDLQSGQVLALPISPLFARYDIPSCRRKRRSFTWEIVKQ